MSFAPAAFASTKKEVGDAVRIGAYSESVIPSHDFAVVGRWEWSLFEGRDLDGTVAR